MKIVPQDKLIVALDTGNLISAQKLVGKLGKLVSIYKVGIELFTAVGPEILKWLKKKEKKIFLDLKFHDIPRSVSSAILSAAGNDIFMVNIHLSGGAAMAREAVIKVKEISKKEGKEPPLIIGVTVLTSLLGDDLKRMGINKDLETLVRDFAIMAEQNGLDGVVASAREARMIKENSGREFLIVTPGIRLKEDSPGDQKRVTTPKEAIAAGADFLVVGRPITEAPNPCRIAQRILSEIKEGQNC
ncbi:MAG: orotidine-5'-phosphate decarboxylase [Candidatus Ratteibacteria bacterium]|nr:orotidine-5'-phosphate decarboxylase [Candidatus Ratteibacteria bacterium]